MVSYQCGYNNQWENFPKTDNAARHVLHIPGQSSLNILNATQFNILGKQTVMRNVRIFRKLEIIIGT